MITSLIPALYSKSNQHSDVKILWKSSQAIFRRFNCLKNGIKLIFYNCLANG
jgi:hypothetical protein